MCQHDGIVTSLSAQRDGPQAWQVAIAAFAANMLAFGTLFSFGVFLTPIGESFDVTTGPVAPLFSGSVFVYYLTGVVAGRIGDRKGVRPVVLVGAVSLAVGLALTAQTTALWQTYATFVPLVGIGVGCCYSPMLGAIGRWFDRSRSLAIGVVLAGVGAGTLFGPLLLRAGISEFGWRTTFRILAVVCFVVIGGAAMAVRPSPEAAQVPHPGDGAEPNGGTLASFARSRRFRRLYLSQVIIGPGFFAPFAFYNDFSIEQGVSSGRAAALIGISGACSVVSRLILGSIGDRFDGLSRYRFSFVLLTATLVVWLVADGSYLLLVASALLHGLGWALWVTATPAVLADWFGVEKLGGALGLFYTGLGFGALVGPALSGFIVDNAGYLPAIMVVTVAAAASTALTFRSMADEEPSTPSHASQRSGAAVEDIS